MTDNGLPQTIPELSKQISDFRQEMETRLDRVETNLGLLNDKFLSPIERMELNRRLAQ